MMKCHLRWRSVLPWAVDAKEAMRMTKVWDIDMRSKNLH